MRRIILATIALLWAVSAANAQLTLTGAGKKPGGASGSAVLTFQGEIGYATPQAATNDPNTCAAMSFGSAFSNREVIAVITVGGSYHGLGSLSVTIGGVTASTSGFVGSGASVNNFSSIIVFAWANVPTGTSGDVVFNGIAASGDSHVACAVYTFDKSLALNSSPTTSSNNVANPATSDTVTLNTGAGGFIIAPIAVEILGSPTGISITSSTETYVSDATTSGDHRNLSSKKSGSAANTPTSVTWSWTGGSQALAALLAWN